VTLNQPGEYQEHPMGDSKNSAQVISKKSRAKETLHKSAMQMLIG